MKILMVCLGNICRSPLAEGLMKHHLSSVFPDFSVDSAGTGNWHCGEAPDHRSVKVAAKYGIDISLQRARQITIADFEDFDLIFTMDASVLRDVQKMVSRKEHLRKIHLLRTYAGHPESKVPDPYYNGAEAFEEVYHMIDDACKRIATQLKEQKTSS
jgi:protein-tyrosine phosphatase